MPDSATRLFLETISLCYMYYDYMSLLSDEVLLLYLVQLLLLQIEQELLQRNTFLVKADLDVPKTPPIELDCGRRGRQKGGLQRQLRLGSLNSREGICTASERRRLLERILLE